jgi:S1-C subfamily serine protease
VPRSREQIALSFAPVVRAAAPAVVNVYTRKALPRSPLNPFAADPFFRFFFDELGRRELRGEPENSIGSGVIVQSDGLIVTNYHVIEGAEEIMVVLADRREFRAQVVGADEPADLAILDIESDGLPALPRGDSDGLEVGGDGLARAWLGAAVQPVDVPPAESLGLRHPVGVLVNQIYPGGPAARAGLAPGDVILAVDGREVQDPKGLNFRLAIGALGDDALLEVWRRGDRISLRLPLETPPYLPEPQPTTLNGRQPLAGATVANLSPGLNKDLNIDLFQQGVVVLKVERGGQRLAVVIAG